MASDCRRKVSTPREISRIRYHSYWVLISKWIISDGSQNSIRFLVKASKRLSEQACYRYRKIATAQTHMRFEKVRSHLVVSNLTEPSHGRELESLDSLSDTRFVESSISSNPCDGYVIGFPRFVFSLWWRSKYASVLRERVKREREVRIRFRSH